MNIKKFNIKVLIFSILFVSFFVYANLILLGEAQKRNTVLVGELFYEQISNRLEKDNEIIKNLVAKISNSETIKNILTNNIEYTELSQTEKNQILEQINIFEGVLDELSFVNSVNIVSIKGNYLFSNGQIYDDFDIRTRSWFKEEYLNPNKDNVIVTNIHEDFTTNKNTMSYVEFINSQDGKEVIGAVVLDIYIEELLDFIETAFIFENLQARIVCKSGTIYTSKDNNMYKDIDFEDKNITNYYKIAGTEDIFNNESHLEMIFDKKTISEYLFEDYADKVIIIMGIFLLIVMIIAINVMFNPILKATLKLKELLIDISDEDEVDIFGKKNKKREIEVISESLEKSFDKKIKNLIYYDHLTNLPNRKYLNMMCKDMQDLKEPFSLIFIDVNNFKSINDNYGHSTGDDFLIKFSQKLEQIFKEKGIVSRYSGDEFVILYKNIKDENELLDFYNNNVKKAFKEPLYINKKLSMIAEFSAGAAIYPIHGKTYSDIIKKSDFMMYKNKNNKTTDLTIFNREIYDEYLYLDNLKRELKYAIKNQEFVIYYQPIINSKKQVKKAEALIRWNSKKLGFVPPDKFIKHAEETRDIIEIGYWIVDDVCKTLRKLNEQNIFIQMSINVSPIQIMESNFVEKVCDIIQKNNVKYEDICFEITESVLLDENNVVDNNISKLRQNKINIALDDFGTGYASFSYLKKYPLDILKLDRIFIKDNNKNDFEIVKSIKNIAKILDIKIVVEGVEDEKQFSELSEIGCDFLQGYYFSKPLLIDDFKEIIINNS